MSTANNIAQWSTTAADNADSDTGLPVMSDTMDPIGLDNVPRGMMAALAKWRKDVGGAITAGGTANALTASTSSGLEAAHLADGLMLVVRATANNSNASVTLNVDATGAKAIKRADGSALVVGSIKAGQYLILIYSATASEWRAANIAPEITALSGNLSVAGTLSVTGAATLSSTLAVTGAATFSGGGTLGDASGDSVVIKGTTVNAFSSGLLDNSSASAWRSDLGLGSLATVSTINNSNWSGTDLAVANGGTGASDASGARTNLGATSVGEALFTAGNQASGRTALGLGSLATSNSINDGDWSGTDLSVANGGTGASSASAARTNLGLGSLATASSINNSNWSGTALAVGNGGTGQTTTQAAIGVLLNQDLNTSPAPNSLDRIAMFVGGNNVWNRMSLDGFLERAFRQKFGTTKGTMIWFNGSNWAGLAPP